ncbi:MAG TPA: VWA domain-containing protein [Firmicutes bacterium]|nr:VWA domain-containing protein [Bacillota bacterium]
MKKGLTELVFILDKSGSMGGLESDTIGGYNAMLNKQKKLPGECYVTTVLFDHGYELLHDRIEIRAISPISSAQYQVGGTTALLDALGRTIFKVENVQKHTERDYRADKVLFVIITDGHENSSREFSASKVKTLIEQKKVDQGWEFVFLGANIDAVETAGRYGIAPDRAQSFHADEEGIRLNFQVMSDAVASFRTKAAVPADWQEKIEDDYKRRGGDQ